MLVIRLRPRSGIADPSSLTVGKSAVSSLPCHSPARIYTTYTRFVKLHVDLLLHNPHFLGGA